MSVAALKREANTGKMRLEILERYGKTGEDLPLKLRGVRRVLSSNSVALRIENTDGTVSSLFVDTGLGIRWTFFMIPMGKMGFLHGRLGVGLLWPPQWQWLPEVSPMRRKARG